LEQIPSNVDKSIFPAFIHIVFEIFILGLGNEEVDLEKKFKLCCCGDDHDDLAKKKKEVHYVKESERSLLVRAKKIPHISACQRWHLT